MTFFWYLYVIVRAHHDHFDSLSDRVRFVSFFFLQDTGEMTELPDGPTLTALTGQLDETGVREQGQRSLTNVLCRTS